MRDRPDYGVATYSLVGDASIALSIDSRSLAGAPREIQGGRKDVLPFSVRRLGCYSQERSHLIRGKLQRREMVASRSVSLRRDHKSGAIMQFLSRRFLHSN